MANTIKIRNSGTTTNVPSALENGEIAVNYADGILFFKDGGGTIQPLAERWRDINAQVGTTYTFVLADTNKLVTLTNGSDITATVPSNANVAYPVGTQILLAQRGAGDVTVNGQASVNIRVPEKYNAVLDGQYSHAVLTKIGTDEWDLSGRLTRKFVQTITFSQSGTLTTGTGASRWSAPAAMTITNVRASVGTSPTGSTLIVDVNKNGTTIFTTQGNRPTIAISSNADTAAVPDVTAVAANDYLTVDIDQIGSTVAGADLTVQIEFES